MRITPADIHNKKFKTGFRGYDADDVDRFLDEISVQLDSLTKENEGLAKKVNELESLISKYQGLEQALNSALVNAEKLAEDIINKANLEAGNILSEAKREAKQMFEESSAQRNEILKSIKRLQRLDKEAKEKLINVIENFMNMINESEDIVSEDVVRQEEGLSAKIDEFIASAAVAGDDVPQEEAAEEPVAVQSEAVEGDVLAGKIETLAEKKEPAESKIAVEEAGSETSSQLAEASEKTPAETTSDNSSQVSDEEKAALFNVTTTGKETGEIDNPFADLGEGVPGIRRKKKLEIPKAE